MKEMKCRFFYSCVVSFLMNNENSETLGKEDEIIKSLYVE